MEDDVLAIRFDAAHLAAIDAWIARHDAPRPSREEAVRQLVGGRLGVGEPGTAIQSTVLPGLVTGRDIV